MVRITMGWRSLHIINVYECLQTANVTHINQFIRLILCETYGFGNFGYPPTLGSLQP